MRRKPRRPGGGRSVFFNCKKNRYRESFLSARKIAIHVCVCLVGARGWGNFQVL